MIDLVSPGWWWWSLAVLVVVGVALRWSLVDRPRALRVAALACRVVAILLLILALCRPFVPRTVDDLHVVFLLDVSESVDLGAAETAIDDIDAAIEELASSDSWDLRLVAAGSRPTTPAAARATLTNWQEGLADARFRRDSHLAEALRGSRALFPSGCDRLVVLCSDGKATGDELDAALSALAADGIRVQQRPLAGLDRPEAAVVDLQPASPQGFQGEVQRFTARLSANRSMPARLRLIHRGVAVADRRLELPADSEQEVHFDLPLPVAGPSRWTAELLPAEDHFQANNQASCTIHVHGQARLLIIHSEPVAMRPLARALRQQDFAVDVRGHRGLPTSLDDLLAFDAILLADLPATELSLPQMDRLKAYVNDFGGGLGMLGSDQSFGLGGYYRTPVEDVLPLTSRYEKEKERPSMAMVLVIDKSGSMSGAPIALARQAARSAAELIASQDHIGVVAFDGAARVIAAMRTGLERDETLAAIDRLAAGGGTFLYPALAQAQQMLDEIAAKVKHVIVLSDGHSQPADHLGLARMMGESGITVSTVGLGNGCDQQLLQSIAQAGSGRFYHTTDPGNVPQIFTRETVEASRSAIKEDLFQAVITSNHPVLAPFDAAELPMALGYVMTRPKPAAQILLTNDSGDPLLAIARFGLGHGLAFTADLTERWGADWLAWDQCGRFWAQILRQIARQGDRQGLTTTTSVNGPRWTADIRRVGASGQPLDGLQWDARLLDGDGGSDQVPIEQVGLGRYQLSLPLAGRDRFIVRLHDQDYDKTALLAWHRPAPREYALHSDVPAALTSLPAFAPARIRDGVRPAPTRDGVRHWAAFAALAFLILGLALRRI